MLPHQPPVENRLAHPLGRDARHRGHLTEHLIDAEVDQDFAEIEIEELGRHGAIG